MYLIIFEDNEVRVSNEITENSISACTDGYCDLIDISDSTNPKMYNPNDEIWVSIDSVEESD